MLADVVHSIRLCLFRRGELVNPDCLRHVVPPASGSTVAHAQRRKHLPGGAAVLRQQPGRDVWLIRLTGVGKRHRLFAAFGFPSRCSLFSIKVPCEILKASINGDSCDGTASPSSWASCSAAVTFRPEEVPANIPSSFARRRAISRAAPSSTVRASSYSPSFKCGGRKPAAIPSTRCGPPFPEVSTGEAAGSSATMRALHPASLSARD